MYFSSMRPVHREDDPSGAKHDADVRQQRPFADIRRLERDDLLKVGHLVSTIDLPRTRDPRLHVEPRVMMRLVQLHL